jgi:lipoprotein-anchoring transpeptidase ErfK/SrfK
MMSESLTALQALQRAQEAFRRGDKRSARRWAEHAATLEPASEDPWLLLAAVSTPRASVLFLERALQANPGSERAQKGMQWALKRLEAEKTQSVAVKATQPVRPAAQEITQPASRPVAPSAISVTKPNRSGAGTAGEKPVRRSVGFSLALLLIACLTVAAFLWTDTSPAQANWAPALVAKTDATAFPTLTPLPSSTAAEMNSSPPDTDSQATSIPIDALSATPTLLPTVSVEIASPTPLPTDAPTEEPSPTPLPTDTAAPAPVVQPAPSSGAGKLILVDISEQHMYVYDGDTLVYSFVISTGMRGATRVGAFSVLDKIPNAYGSTWNIWMPNWLGIYYSGHLENGIHALPILSNGQRLWAGYLGTPISYGCVVLGVYESELLYNWADVGTPVVIQY